jgi:hypothetical protein
MNTRGELSRREIGFLLLGATLLALLMHWPLPLHLGSDVPKDITDPMGQSWQLAWIGDALLHQPGDLFQANIWWPLDNTLASTDILFGYTPAALIGTGPEAALVRHNLLFFFAYAVAFIGAYLLARELGVGPVGATVAGAAFAYAPWRLGHDAQLNILSSGGIPLSVFLLLRGYRRDSPGTVLAGWLVATWQLLLGIGLGIQLAYLLLILGALAAVYWYRRRPRVPRAVVVATVAGIASLVLTTVFLARPYLDLREENPEAKRTLSLISGLSPDVGGFFRAPPGNLVWGPPPQGIDESIPQREFTLFPGLAIGLLAVAGALAPVYPRRRRLVLVLAVGLLAALSLGWREHRTVPLQPYKLVFEYLPGWDAIRVPSRINTLTSLGLALLAAAGAHQVAAVSRRWTAARRPGWGGVATGVVATVLVAAILIEGSGFQFRDGGVDGPQLARVPPVPPGQLGAPEPQLHLPNYYTYRSGSGPIYVFWSINGFPETVNGWGGFVPDQDLEIYYESIRFPDPASVATLRARGIRTVVLHTNFVWKTEWEHAAERPVKGLPLRREVKGDVILYHLKPSRG